jgi:hypothetical protein
MTATRTSPPVTPRSSENGTGPVRLRLAAPPLSGVLRIVLIIVATALALYLVWRLRGLIQLLAITLFFAVRCSP